jgi:capsular polysaccharide biosynthesis protein
VNELTGKGFYQKCDFINTSSQIDSRVAANAIKDAEISLNSSRIHILPFGRRSFNFGHWHLNTLSSIYLALKHVPDAIVVLPMLNKWQKESLVSLGLYDKNKIIEIPLLESCIVPNAMFFSTTFTWHGIPNVKPMISMFKDACFFSNPPEGVSEKWPTPPSKIYLSRKSDPSHKLVNEQLVEEEFASRGFVILEPQSISYHELAYLLAHVDILAGQSGAALIRAGICRPGTIFIQLCYEGFTDYIYHKVAALSGFSKSYLYVEPEQSIIVDREAGKASHFHKISGWSINVKNFKAFMKSIF